MSRRGLTPIFLYIACLFICSATALNFKINPKENLCFHEITHKGNKVLAFFDVLSWGYGAYVDLRVTAPSGREIQKFEAESEGRVDFIATEDGEHNFCFFNAQTETEISFWVNTESDSALSDVAKQEHVNDMVYSVEKLNSLVSAARVDLDAFKAREHHHRKEFHVTRFTKQDIHPTLRCTARRTVMATNVTMTNSNEERFDVLRDDGMPMGFSKPRSLVHRDGDWHRSTHIWVLSSEGEVLVQKRAVGKDTFPERWDVSAAGHITAGDESFPSAQRELEEELGIRVASPSDLCFAMSVKASAKGYTERHGAYTDNEIQDIYVYWPVRTVAIDDMKLQVEEVECVEYWNWDSYRKRSCTGDESLVPRSPMYRELFFPWLTERIEAGSLLL